MDVVFGEVEGGAGGLGAPAGRLPPPPPGGPLRGGGGRPPRGGASLSRAGGRRGAPGEGPGRTALAHRPADATLKSPRGGKVAHPCPAAMACASAMSANSMRRCWKAAVRHTCDRRQDGRVISCSIAADRQRWLPSSVRRRTLGKDGSLTVAHAGAYFETAALLDTWPQRVFRQVPASPVEAVDIVIAEPVSCDGCFASVGRLPRARRAILLDTTMVGPGHDLARYLPARADSCSLVIAYNSGLKLDQAGLELANAGIVRILAREDGEEDATSVGAASLSPASLAAASPSTSCRLSPRRGSWTATTSIVTRRRSSPTTGRWPNRSA